MTTVRVEFDARRLRRFAWDPNLGPARKGERTAEQVRAAAQRRAPVGQTRQLRDTINVQGPLLGTRGLQWWVVAPQPYAQWIVTGRRRDRRVRGGMVYATAGPRPFLADALREVLGYAEV